MNKVVHYVDVNMMFDEDVLIRQMKDAITTMQDLLGSIREEMRHAEC